MAEVPKPFNRATDGTLTLDAAPPDWMHRYGPQGFAIGADARVVRDPWSIINLSPHFPSTAQVIQELYPQSGGRHLDGVFSLDVFALERRWPDEGACRCVEQVCQSVE